MSSPAGVPGVFADGAPYAERALATVIGGEIRIEPADPDAYPPGFVLRTAREALIWRGRLVPDRRREGEEPPLNRQLLVGVLLTRYLERVHGRPGTWVLFGDGDAGFRPDEWDELDEVLDRKHVPRRDDTTSPGPPEPNGGLLLVGLYAVLGIVMAACGAISWLPKGDPKVVYEYAVPLVVLGAAFGGAWVFGRWWMNGLLVSVSRRRRRRGAIGGRAQPVGRRLPGWRTVAAYMVLGLVLGTALLAVANPQYRSAAFPLVGSLVGLGVGLVWVAFVRRRRGVA